MSVRLFANIGRRALPPAPLRIAAVGAIALTLAVVAYAQRAEFPGAAHRRDVNAVTYWNAIADAAFTPLEGTNPMAQLRTLAILHAAIETR